MAARPRPTPEWTRYSLIYLASYLALTGVAFLAVPRRAVELLLTTEAHDVALIRFIAAFMIALAALVVQIIRHRLEVLYATTLAVRVFFLVVIGALYLDTSDRMFAVIWGVVALGVALTSIGLLIDHRRKEIHV